MTDQKQNWWRPLTSHPKQHRIAALDCEGNGAPGGFVCAALVWYGGTQTFTSRKDAIGTILSRPFRDTWIFCHNLEYDLSTLFSGDLRTLRVLFAGNRIIYAELVDEHRHKWRLVDSTNILTNTSIKELGGLVGRAKLEPHHTLITKLQNGTPFYLLTPDEQRQTLDYCKRDAEIVYLAMTEVQEKLLSLGGELKPTVAGISMDLFRRRYMQKAWPTVDPATNKLARTAYYGGRCEPFRLGLVKGVNGYDISSLYPSVMRDVELPYPGYLTYEESPHNFGYLLDREGVSQCQVTVPDSDPPLLPGRIKRHLFFPTGDLAGAWPHNELRAAIAGGVKINKVDWTIHAKYTFSPFEQFIDDLYGQRVLAASDSPALEHFFKIVLNASYGRFGINPDGGLKELVAILDNDHWEQYKGARLFWLQNIPYALVEVGNDQPPPYANAMIAAYITAAARLKMYPYINDNLNSLLYTDTDSLWLDGTVDAPGGLGNLRQTHSDMEMWIVAPKEYAIFHNEWLHEAAAKGIPEAHRLFYLRTGYAVFDSPIGLREGLRSGLTPATWTGRYKEKRYMLPKRPPVLAEGARSECYPTRPWEWRELAHSFELAQAHQPYFEEHLSPKVRHLLARVENAQAEFG